MDNLLIAIPMKDPQFAKTRLASSLSSEKRQKLAIGLFQNTVEFFRKTYPSITTATVTASKSISELALHMDANIIHEPVVSGLNNAATLASDWATKNNFSSLLIIPADIPRLIKTEIDQVFNKASHYRVVIIESSNGGTNTLLLSPPNCLPFHYGKNSAKAHEACAKKASLSCLRYSRKYLSQDLDTFANFLALIRD